jgi:hypothetical protein
MFDSLSLRGRELPHADAESSEVLIGKLEADQVGEVLRGAETDIMRQKYPVGDQTHHLSVETVEGRKSE